MYRNMQKYLRAKLTYFLYYAAIRVLVFVSLERSSSIDASLKVSVDRNTRITTAEARIGTKPGLVVSVETPTGRRSQSFDTRMEGEANNPCVLALLADKAVRTPTDLPNAPMYRSDSASKLTNKKHQQVDFFLQQRTK